MLETHVGQHHARLFRGQLGGLRAQLLGQRGTARQCIGHFPEAGLDRLFILGHCNVAADLGRLQVGLVASGIEDRLQQLGYEGPGRGAVAEQLVQFAAGHTGAGCERDARKERGTRGADVGVVGQQYLLGLAHIGAACQQLGRDARGQIGNQALRGEGQACWQVRRQGLAHQQYQCVFIQSTLPGLLGQRRLGAFQGGLGLAQVQLRSGLVVKLQARQPQ